MKNIILPHQDAEEIQKIFLNNDLQKWQEELEMIRLEIKFFNTLLISDLVQVLDSNPEDAVFLNKNLLHFENENERFIQSQLSFNNEMQKLNECEDLHCDTYFLNEHAQFRIQIDTHFAEFRKLKTLVITYVNKGVIDYLGN